jgi:hypothetical protein
MLPRFRAAQAYGHLGIYDHRWSSRLFSTPYAVSTAILIIRREVDLVVFAQPRVRSPLRKEGDMNDINLPKHIVDRIEARWGARQVSAKEKREIVDRQLEQLRAHRNNIQRYRWLLSTQLSDLERNFIERRLSEESSAMENLAAEIPLLVHEQRPPSIPSRSEGASP